MSSPTFNVIVSFTVSGTADTVSDDLYNELKKQPFDFEIIEVEKQ